MPVIPFDLQTDTDGDGLPDELMAALAEMDTLEAAYKADPTPERAAAMEAALERFTRRLLFDDTVRALQVQLYEAHVQLRAAAYDEAATNAALAEIHRLEAALQAHPTFGLVSEILTTRLDTRFQSKAPVPTPTATTTPENAAAPQAVQSAAQAAEAVYAVFMPMVWDRIFAPDPACLGVATTERGQANFARLERGDLLFFQGESKLRNFAYARKFSHVGIFDGPNENNEQQVYESDAAYVDDPDGGPKLRNLTDYWNTLEGHCIALARFDSYLLSGQIVEDALADRQQAYGVNGETPYPELTSGDLLDYWLNKAQDEKIYCSLLPWKVFDTVDGVDIDSNDLRYRAWFVLKWGNVVTNIGAWEAGKRIVAPDEIYLHENMILYSEGVNP